MTDIAGHNLYTSAPRNISAPMLAALQTNNIRPALLASITFKSMTSYVWTGARELVYDGHTYLGVGDFGQISPVTEGTDVRAYGMTISLSGIDTTLLQESMTDIQIGAPVKILFALFDSTGNIYGTPYPLFVGCVDKPSLQIGTKELTISLALETRLTDLQRANQRKYTSADQHLYYPDDCAFEWVEQLNDQALRWV